MFNFFFYILRGILVDQYLIVSKLQRERERSGGGRGIKIINKHEREK